MYRETTSDCGLGSFPSSLKPNRYLPKIVRAWDALSFQITVEMAAILGRCVLTEFTFWERVSGYP